MEFQHSPTPWKNAGVEPPNELIDTGFVAGYKPPAGYFNWIFNKYTSCITELQTLLSDCEEGKADKLHIHDPATTEENGFLSKEDKAKLDELAGGGGGVKDYLVLENRPNMYQKKGGFFKGTSPEKIPGDISPGCLVLVKDRSAISDSISNLIPNEQMYPIMDVPSLSLSLIGDHVLGKCCIGAGQNLRCDGKNSVLCGDKNTLSAGSEDNLCGGYGNLINYAANSMISGVNNSLNTVTCSVVSGGQNTANDTSRLWYSLLVGTKNKILGTQNSVMNSLIAGEGNTIDYINAGTENSVIAGISNTCKGAYCSLVAGNRNEVNGGFSVVCGSQLISASLASVLGKRNKAPTESTIEGITGDLFIIGNGSGNVITRSNAFRVTAGGDIYGTKAFNSAGADYAEYFEWADGNPTNEDRRGLFVTLDGEQLKKADAGDFIIGVISSTPSVVGDNYADDWQGKYKRDVFGTRLLEDTAIPDEFDKNGKIKVLAHTEKQWVLSSGFNSDLDEKETPYIPRDKRKEWSPVGMMGKLITVDDGTCRVNGFCAAGVDGVATKSETGYRVMKRLDERHIKILVI